MSVLCLRIVIWSWQWRYRRDKKLFRPAAIRTWTIVIYESQGRFRQDTAREMAKGFIEGALNVGECIHYIAFFYYYSKIDWFHAGMIVTDHQPLIFWESGQGNISEVWFFSPMKHSRRWRDLTFLSNWRRLARPALTKKEVHQIW